MNNFLLVLKNKSFFSLWLSEIFSLTGFHMVNFLLILIAFSLTNSNTAVSGVVLAFSIPAILFGVVAGIYVDRWNKRQVLFVTNAVRFFLVILLGLFFKNLPVLYSVTFAVAIVTQFFIPAETPIIPLLVEKKHLLFANALFSLAWFGAALIAYALSGPLLSFFGTTYALFIIAGFFLIAAFCVLGIQYTHHTISQNQGVSEHVFTQIKKTFQIIFETKNIAHA